MQTAAHARAVLLGASLSLLPAFGQAQSLTPPPSPVHFWLAAGPGIGTVSTSPFFPVFERRTAFAAVGSVQYKALVVSTRTAFAGLQSKNAWDVGVLAGLGSSTVPAFHGSIAAGVGRAANGLGASGVALPVELQLAWRLTNSFGAGVYAFGSFSRATDFFGATLAFRIGRLH